MLTPRSSGVVTLLALTVCASSALAQELRPGAIIDPVPCVADPAQTYALYLPPGYSHDRQSSVLLAFHPAALGTDRRREPPRRALMTLRNRLSKLAHKARADADTPERSQARRVLCSVTAGASERVRDREYLTLLEQYRLQGR